jgi:exportin-7
VVQIVLLFMSDVVQLVLSMQNHYDSYPKISKIYFGLLEILFRNHMSLLCDLDHRVLRILFSSLRDGIQHHDVTQSSLAATALDHIFSFAWKQSRKREPEMSYQRMIQILAESDDIFGSVMNSLLSMVIFENLSHNWALCRPIFSLLLIRQEVRNLNSVFWITRVSIESISFSTSRRSKLG